jgi:hypothetical protein
MLERLLQKIAEVREQPEHIRMRWALGSVLVCMVFIIGIWFLTLKQGFLGASTEARAGIGTVKSLGSDVQNSDTSLKDLLKSDKTLSVDQKTLTGDEFLQKELEKKQTTPTTTIPNQPQE